MPHFLSDPPPAAYVVLVLAALVGGGLWYRYRRRMLLMGVAILVTLFILLSLMAVSFESPREQSNRRVREMAQALTEKNWAKFADHVSESFDANGLKKADLKKGFDLGVQYNLRVVAWEFALAEPVTYTDDTVVIRFDAKAEARSGEQLAKHFQATFTKDPDGQFRMTSFTPFNYVQKKLAEPIPGLTR
jgi:hypothetical protein